MNAIISPDYYYVLTVAGQSNAMAYGEGLPLPDKEDVLFSSKASDMEESFFPWEVPSVV